MHKRELINLIFNYFYNDLASINGEAPTLKDLENLKESQLWSIALDLDLFEDELP
jgi:hypothetical protein